MSARVLMMTDRRFLTVTGASLILTAILVILFGTLLQVTFDWPAILDEPTDRVLREFHEDRSILVALFYGLMLAFIIYVVPVVMLQKVLAPQNRRYMAIATTFGVLAALGQFLGLVRYVFVVPYLEEVYADPTSSETTRDSVLVVFQAFHRYAGVALGEHLGYMFTVVWSVPVAITMFKSWLFKPWLGWLGLLASLCIFVGLFAEIGVDTFGTVLGIGFILWSIWLTLSGAMLLRAHHMVPEVRSRGTDA